MRFIHVISCNNISLISLLIMLCHDCTTVYYPDIQVVSSFVCYKQYYYEFSCKFLINMLCSYVSFVPGIRIVGSQDVLINLVNTVKGYCQSTCTNLGSQQQCIRIPVIPHSWNSCNCLSYSLQLFWWVGDEIALVVLICIFLM